MRSAIALDDDHVAALATMTMHARCVAGPSTDQTSGYVDVDVARDLATFGFCREDEGQPGVAVFVITSAGFAALEAQTPREQDHDADERPERP